VTAITRDSHRRFRYRDAADLRRDIAALDLSIPWDDDPTPLLSPVRVGDRTLPNRLAVHPMEGFDARADGSPGELAFRRYRRYGAGGSGLIWFEATAVVEEGRSNPRQFYLHEANVGEFGRLVSETRQAATGPAGADGGALLILQLTHSGRWSKPDDRRRPLIVHHNAVLDAMVDIDATYPVVSDAALDRLQDAFVDAARLAASAGFDGVDVKACHGYLVSELLAGFTREGRYGGSLENRSRFLLDTVQRIRAEVPGLLVTSRINVFDGLPYPYGFGVARDEPDEPDLAEPRHVLEKLQGQGCELANVSLGVPYCRPHLGRPFNRAVPGSPSAPEHPLVGVARHLALARRLQRALPELRLVGTGYSWLRHFFPYVGAAAVREGGISIVGLGRMAFAYPDFARDLSEHGTLNARKSCVGCSSCSELMRDGRMSGCVVRDGDLYHLREPVDRELKGGRA
jgi:2,4-dienoyl-CoA reductase-like NADH-dependent reductase (Old Yellow Enzyme family)